MRRWRLRHLMGSWIAWWVALGAVALGPAVPALWKVYRAARSSTGEVTGGISDAELGAKVVLDGVELWSGSAHALVAVGWIVVPPLVLLALFLRGARGKPRMAQLAEGGAPADVVSQRTRDGVRQDR